MEFHEEFYMFINFFSNVERKPTLLYAHLGEEVSLNLELNITNKAIKWFFNKNYKNSIAVKDEGKNFTSVDKNIELMDDGTLKILKMKLSVEGLYECEMIGSDSNSVPLQQISLNVLGKWVMSETLFSNNFQHTFTKHLFFFIFEITAFDNSYKEKTISNAIHMEWNITFDVSTERLNDCNYVI